MRRCPHIIWSRNNTRAEEGTWVSMNESINHAAFLPQICVGRLSGSVLTVRYEIKISAFAIEQMGSRGKQQGHFVSALITTFFPLEFRSQHAISSRLTSLKAILFKWKGCYLISKRHKYTTSIMWRDFFLSRWKTLRWIFTHGNANYCRQCFSAMNLKFDKYTYIHTHNIILKKKVNHIIILRENIWIFRAKGNITAWKYAGSRRKLGAGFLGNVLIKMYRVNLINEYGLVSVSRSRDFMQPKSMMCSVTSFLWRHFCLVFYVGRTRWSIFSSLFVSFLKSREMLL